MSSGPRAASPGSCRDPTNCFFLFFVDPSMDWLSWDRIWKFDRALLKMASVKMLMSNDFHTYVTYVTYVALSRRYFNQPSHGVAME